MTDAFDAGYEEGDINVIADVSDEVDEGNVAGAEMAESVLTYLAQSLADEPDGVVVTQEPRRGAVSLRLHVAPGDMGRVIGRRGRTAQAIRTLVAVAGARQGVSTLVDIADD
jgi:hypothetical protein